MAAGSGGATEGLRGWHSCHGDVRQLLLSRLGRAEAKRLRRKQQRSGRFVFADQLKFILQIKMISSVTAVAATSSGFFMPQLKVQSWSAIGKVCFTSSLSPPRSQEVALKTNMELRHHFLGTQPVPFSLKVFFSLMKTKKPNRGGVNFLFLFMCLPSLFSRNKAIKMQIKSFRENREP